MAGRLADRLGRVPVMLIGSVLFIASAIGAGLATGVWKSVDELSALVREGRRWAPRMGAEDRARLLRLWNRAVERSLGWVDDDVRALTGEQ